MVRATVAKNRPGEWYSDRGRLMTGDAGSILIGVNPDSTNPDRGEIDTLIGGQGADTFVLGDTTRAYYDDTTIDSGLGDYALIRDFTPGVDTLKFYGNTADYQFNPTPAGLPAGTAIFRTTNNQSELIAIVQEGNPDLENELPPKYFSLLKIYGLV